MTARTRNVTSALCLTVLSAFAFGCPKTVPPTLVGSSVGTFVKLSGIGLPSSGSACLPASPTPPDPLAAFNALAPADRNFPFAGYELYRNTNTGCTASSVNAYRAVVTFNMAGVSNLKGLVQKAELIVAVRAMPDSAGRVHTFPGVVAVMCPLLLGGGGALQRFGPAATVPQLSTQGTLTVLTGPDPFPTATSTVYTFPTFFTAGPVAGATSPTTLAASGQGGSTFTTDVTGQVNAALNGGFAAMSWMLTSNFEGPIPSPVFPGHALACKTSYDFQLKLTHL